MTHSDIRSKFIKFFEERGLGDMSFEGENAEYLKNMAEVMGLPLEKLRSEYGIKGENYAFPKHPIEAEENGKKSFKPKLERDPDGGSAMLAISPEDVKGNFDFSVDVESMSVNSDDERKQGRQTAVSLLVSNPNIMAFLQQEGVKPKFKELFITWLEDLGFSDAQKFFESAGAQAGVPSAAGGKEDQLAQIMKMFQGGQEGQQGGDPTQQLKEVAQEMNPGTGANQVSKVIPSEAGQEQQPTVGEANPEQFKSLVNRFSEGGQYAGQ